MLIHDLGVFVSDSHEMHVILLQVPIAMDHTLAIEQNLHITDLLFQLCHAFGDGPHLLRDDPSLQVGAASQELVKGGVQLLLVFFLVEKVISRQGSTSMTYELE